MKTEILIAHPGKHHALHLVVGCIKSGASVQYVTPFYRCGLGRLVSALPGNVGNKARGYFHPDIPLRSVISPVWWQLRKLFSLYKYDLSYERAFDKFVAHAIETGKYRAKVLVTLQDYMPDTVRAAQRRGYLIWSDQILNQSDEMASRILLHEEEMGLDSTWQHSECNNNEIITASNVITVPSNYCSNGIKERVAPHTRIAIIPYGASDEQFTVKRLEDPQQIVILARAQSFRKGGHLLLSALQQCGAALLAISAPKKIKVVIMGNLEPMLRNILDGLVLPKGLTVVYGNVAHAIVPKLYQQASLFVMPSLSEGRSLACLEAMHAELPLIITPYCGVDGFEHGRMGYEIADTAISLSTALVEAFKNRQSWPQWGLNSKQLASQLTWTEYERAISSLTREILC